MAFKSIAVIGAGAIGSFYGAKLQRYGCKVQFQTSGGASILKNEEMHITSVWGDFSIRADAHAESRTMDTADIVILSTKALENIDYHELLSPVVSEKTIIISIQNGLNLDERLKELFPKQIVIGAAAFVCLNRISHVDIQHLAYGRIDIGFLNPDNESTAKETTSLFKNAGIDGRFSGNIRHIRWKKLLWNIPFNVLSVILMKANTKEMIEDENILRLSKRLMKEVQTLAGLENIIITDDDIENMIKNTKSMVPYKTSMLLDFEAHRPMEVEAILGEPLKIARQSDIDVPGIETLYSELKFLDIHRI